MHLVRHGEKLLEEFHKNVLRGIDLLVILMSEHLDTCIDQENAKESEYPFKPRDDGRTGKDKDTAQHQCSEDAPEEYLMLVFPLDTEE